MSGLLVVATNVLKDPEMSPAMKAVATEALVVAVREGIVLPIGAAWAMWRWLKTLPSNTDWRAAVTLGEIPDVRVRDDAIRILSAADAGSDARSICIDVLSGPAHAAYVPESVLLASVERARLPVDLVVVERLIEAVRRTGEPA